MCFFSTRRRGNEQRVGNGKRVDVCVTEKLENWDSQKLEGSKLLFCEYVQSGSTALLVVPFWKVFQYF